MHRPFVKRGAEDPYHSVFREFISLSRQAHSPSILEIGSRNVTGITRRHLYSHCEEYVGFDILAGDGVDIVGDAHRLSESCPLEHFDFAFSMSVFEHLLFPWKAVLEINKVMKEGGYVFLSTHPVWPAHELPWDFWRFPCNGFHGLFNKYTGFEIVSIAEGLPGKFYSLVDDAPDRGLSYKPLMPSALKRLIHVRTVWSLRRMILLISGTVMPCSAANKMICARSRIRTSLV
jgi:SAM-dependent methyltransferase